MCIYIYIYIYIHVSQYIHIITNLNHEDMLSRMHKTVMRSMLCAIDKNDKLVTLDLPHIHTDIHTHTYIHTYSHAYIHVHTYILTYIHTYIHTYPILQ